MNDDTRSSLDEYIADAEAALHDADYNADNVDDRAAWLARALAHVLAALRAIASTIPHEVQP